jgi:hypothetical protein
MPSGFSRLDDPPMCRPRDRSEDTQNGIRMRLFDILWSTLLAALLATPAGAVVEFQ